LLPGKWSIIGLFVYKAIVVFTTNFCPSELRKIFGKEVETEKGSNNGNGRGALRYSFDEFEVDPSNRICTRDGVPITVSGKVYDILLVFLENPGRLLSKDELLDRVWANEFVEEGNLARNVSTLRKALGDTGRQHRFIVTVPGHGYRFVGEVRESEQASGPPPESTATAETLESRAEKPEPPAVPKAASRKWIAIIATAVVVLTVAWVSSERFISPAPPIKSLAVLPLRGIDPNDNYLGFGIADSVIRRISSSGQVTVRPSSAVLHYLNQDADTLSAARELNTDAVLEGNVQRFGDRLRVSVNLLRSADGSSVWNDSFDTQAADIFRVQDAVAEQVADRLKIKLGSVAGSATGKYPTDPRAYESYLKGIFMLDQRGFTEDDYPQMMETIDHFKRAIEIDPNYALAHAKLAFSYAWMGLFIRPAESNWADLARQEVARSIELDPNLADPHVANGLLYWSAWGGYKVEASIEELRVAKRLDPNLSSPDLVAIYAHAGLETQAAYELKRSLSIDPTGNAINGVKGILEYLRADPDAWRAAHPQIPVEERGFAIWYYLRKGSLDAAQKMIDEQLSHSPKDYDIYMQKALLTALRGNFAKAEEQIPEVLKKVKRNDESYHHATYDSACIYAMAGDPKEAVRWLRETADTGFPNYPLFERDHFLDHIRNAPEFVQFLAEQKTQWERFQKEFPD
jgi:DNA-binding winged helix-turn-helix (wHTH) protein/TolB-like protein/Tfp pilus assembly protein PilF